MATLEEAFEEFRIAAGPYMAEWDGLDVRLMAVKEGGKDVLVLARVMAIRGGNVPPPAYIPEVEGLTFRHAVVELSKLDPLLAGLREGRMVIEGETFMLDAGGGPPKSAAFFVYSRYMGFPGAAVTLEIRMDGASKPRPRDLDRMLPASNPPYADPRDMFGSFFGPEHTNDDWNPRVLFTLAPGIMVKDLSVEGDSVEATIEGASEERARQIRTSLIGRTRDGQEVRWQSEIADGLREEDGAVRWRHRLPEDVTHGRLWFHDRGFLVGESTFAVNGRRGSEVVDQTIAVALDDPDFLRSGLARIRKTDSGGLEFWVHVLFDRLGWKSILVGGGNAETVDVIAFAPERDMIALVECTTATPTQGNKLAKLHARAQHMERETGQAVVPILATNRVSEDISSADRKAARDDDIVLLAREDLQELAEMVPGPDHSEVVAFLGSMLSSVWPYNVRGIASGAAAKVSSRRTRLGPFI